MKQNFLNFLKNSNVRYFFYPKKNSYKLYNDQPIGFYKIFSKKKNVFEKKIFRGNSLNPSLCLLKSGFFLKKNGTEIFFQLFKNIFFKEKSLLYIGFTNFLKKNTIIGYEFSLKNQSDDIAYGLPKVLSLLNAYSPKIDFEFNNRSGFYISKNFVIDSIFNKETFFFQNILLKNSVIIYNRLLYKFFPLFLSIYISRVKNQKILKKSYFTKKCWPFYNSNLWLYKIDKFKIFKWLKLNPYLWIPNFNRPYIINNCSLIQYDSKNAQEIFYNNLVIRSRKSKFYKLELLNILEDDNKIFINDIKNNQMYIPVFPTKNTHIETPFAFISSSEGYYTLFISHIINNIYIYHYLLDGSYKGIFKFLYKIQLLIAFAIEDCYDIQGIKISFKHVEIIVKQMTNQVFVENPKETPLLPKELIKISIIKELCKSIIKYNDSKFCIFPYLQEYLPIFKPILFSDISASLKKDGFLNRLAFQNIKKILIKVSAEGCMDWISHLKQQIIAGQKITAGSAFLNTKYGLDRIYVFKKFL